MTAGMAALVCAGRTQGEAHWHAVAHSPGVSWQQSIEHTSTAAVICTGLAGRTGAIPMLKSTTSVASRFMAET